MCLEVSKTLPKISTVATGKQSLQRPVLTKCNDPTIIQRLTNSFCEYNYRIRRIVKVELNFRPANNRRQCKRIKGTKQVLNNVLNNVFINNAN